MSTCGKLAGKRALVTGSGTGIGREIALEFARQGADVVLHYAHSGQGAESAVEEIRSLGRRSNVFPADFDKIDQVCELAEQAIGFLGGIDCLVNNSGITFNKPFLQVTPEQFDVLYHVNVRAQYFLTQSVARDMLEHGGGAVCNLTSIHGLQGAPEHSVYAGTKGAIIAHTRTLGVELAHQGIRAQRHRPRLGDRRKLLPRHAGIQRRGGHSSRPATPFRSPAPARRWTSPVWPSFFAPTTQSTSSARPWWPTGGQPP